MSSVSGALIFPFWHGSTSLRTLAIAALLRFQHTMTPQEMTKTSAMFFSLCSPMFCCFCSAFLSCDSFSDRMRMCTISAYILIDFVPSSKLNPRPRVFFAKFSLTLDFLGLIPISKDPYVLLPRRPRLTMAMRSLLLVGDDRLSDMQRPILTSGPLSCWTSLKSISRLYSSQSQNPTTSSVSDSAGGGLVRGFTVRLDLRLR
mmetsp:Transcript_7557/g.11674  ORF Transcript_7557/g.11674 Transcript_7557/m.11674 type:complete len:202 (-) Transcript_7557:36-641(-)